MKVNRTFNVDSLLEDSSKNNEPIETIDVAFWANFSVRNIQKFASKYEIPYNRIHGRKYYIWNEKSLLAFKLWYERKNKIPKEYNRPKHKDVRIEKNKINFITIRDVVKENIEDYERDYKRIYRKYMKIIQMWAKKNGIPFEYHFGRKYYVISESNKVYINKMYFSK
jgi:hypothetical protein